MRKNPLSNLVDASGLPPEPTRAFESKRQRGRPRGKRSDPEYTFLTHLQPVDLVGRLSWVAENTIDPDTGRRYNMSDLITEALEVWLDLPKHKTLLDANRALVDQRIEEYRQRRQSHRS